MLLVLLLLGHFEAFSVGFGGAASQGIGLSPVISSPAAFPSLSGDASGMLSNSLRIAAREGRTGEVRRLLEQGADVNGTGAYGETALANAARFDRLQAVELLLSSGAEVNARDSADNTALIQTSRSCSSRIASRLLRRHDLDLNWRNGEGRSALSEAVANGCDEVVAQLVKAKGLRLNTRDASGRTALDVALEEAQLEVGGPYTRIVRILEEAGAETFTWSRIPEARKDSSRPELP